MGKAGQHRTQICLKPPLTVRSRQTLSSQAVAPNHALNFQPNCATAAESTPSHDDCQQRLRSVPGFPEARRHFLMQRYWCAAHLFDTANQREMNPYLPKARVETTSARSYMQLLSGDAKDAA